MTRLILHIGLEKTGTTSFQAFCSENNLAAQGVVYPTNPACFLSLNHAPLAASYFTAPEATRLMIAGRRADRREAIAALEREIAGAETALVSAEHFSSRFDPDRIAALADDLARFETSVAVVVRAPAPRALSAYATTIASGRDITLDAFIDELCAPENTYLHNRAVIEAWSAAFGRDRTVVVAYREGADVTPALVERLIPQAASLCAGGYRRNVSPSATAIERRRRAHAAPWPKFARRMSWFAGGVAPAAGLSAQRLGQITTLARDDLAWLKREYGVEFSAADTGISPSGAD